MSAARTLRRASGDALPEPRWRHSRRPAERTEERSLRLVPGCVRDVAQSRARPTKQPARPPHLLQAQEGAELAPGRVLEQAAHRRRREAELPSHLPELRRAARQKAARQVLRRCARNVNVRDQPNARGYQIYLLPYVDDGEPSIARRQRAFRFAGGQPTTSPQPPGTENRFARIMSAAMSRAISAASMFATSSKPADGRKIGRARPPGETRHASRS